MNIDISDLSEKDLSELDNILTELSSKGKFILNVDIVGKDRFIYIRTIAKHLTENDLVETHYLKSDVEIVMYGLTGEGLMFYQKGGFKRLYDGDTRERKKLTSEKWGNRTWGIVAAVVTSIILWLISLFTTYPAK
jgi:hypothetical protein